MTTSAERMAAKRARDKAKGLVRVEVQVPQEGVAAIQKLAKKLRAVESTESEATE